MCGHGLDGAGCRYRQVAGSGECVGDTSDSLNGGDFLTRLNTVSLLKKDSAAWGK